MATPSFEVENTGSQFEARSEPDGFKTFQLLLLGQFISMIGSGLTRFGLSVWVYQHSGSATQFTLTSLAAILPFMALTPVAGVLVDRFNRRWILIVSTSGTALSLLVLALFLYFDRLEIWHIYVSLTISACFGALQAPAFMSSLALLVPKKDLGRANGMGQFASGVSQILSPALAGVFIMVVKVYGVMLIDFVTYLFAIAILFVIHIPNPKPEQEPSISKKYLLKEAALGWTYILERRGLLKFFLLFGLVNFVMSIVIALATPLLLSTFRPSALSSVISVSGIGMLVGSLALGRLGKSGDKATLMLRFMGLCGIFVFLTGMRVSLPLYLVSAFVVSFSVQVVNGCSAILVQTKVQPEVQGRVFSTSLLITSAAMPLALLVAGPLADHILNRFWLYREDWPEVLGK